MSLSFSRSTRTITNDTFRPSLVGLTIAILVLVAWGAWFAVARAPLYESSATLELTREGEILARFDDKPFSQIRPGQTAVVMDANGETRRAEVMEIANRSQNRLEPNTVRLYLYGADPSSASPKQVQIQVGQESPLLALLRIGAGAPLQQGAR
jgi:hypothetical protein